MQEIADFEMSAGTPFQLPPPSHRFPTREVRIGDLRIGGPHPILIQSMTIADTCDTDRVVTEVRQLVDAGCPLIRLTAPSMKDAENLREIRRRLQRDSIRVPMVADIHFTPNAALVAAEIVEKVRINPGNYADRKKFEVFEISDAAYQDELERIRERFLPLVRKLKENGTALRIGTNHGSLSDRIMNRYGDTPEGMVESALEFVRICRAEGYHDLVLSMKSSIASVMIAAYRLLVRRMIEEEMNYPLHVGVTEAGDGLEGRIKSAIGIGSLLASGIGDTIRVSLTEDSRHEIPAARAILAAVARERSSVLDAQPRSDSVALYQTLPLGTSPDRRPTRPWKLRGFEIGGTYPIRIELRLDGSRDLDERARTELATAGLPEGAELVSLTIPASVSLDDAKRRVQEVRAHTGIVPILVELTQDRPIDLAEHIVALAPLVDAFGLPACSRDDGSWTRPPGATAAWLRAASGRPIRWRVDAARPGDHALPPASDDRIRRDEIGETSSPEDPSRLAETLSQLRSLSTVTRRAGSDVGYVCSLGPEMLTRIRRLAAALPEDLMFLDVPAEGPSAAFIAGSLLNDGIGDALCLVPFASSGQPAAFPWPPGGRAWTEDPVFSAYRILQACRIRLTRAEFIACPSCGRTQFDLQATTERIRRRTGHLSGVKIAIMGCIVNGPGEMADADFGYIGSGPAKVDLYVGKERVAKSIPEAEAEDRLVALLREHGAWVDPAEESQLLNGTPGSEKATNGTSLTDSVQNRD